jgi:hypothetical protein
MKKVRYHMPDGSIKVEPVHITAHRNGISVQQVPDLIESWVAQGAAKRRADGGIEVIRYVPAAVRKT